MSERPEVYFDAWLGAGELTYARFLARLTARARDITLRSSSNDPDHDKLGGIHDENSFKMFLRDAFSFHSDAADVAERAFPVLFRMVVYLGRYPFLPPPVFVDYPPGSVLLDSDSLRHALMLASGAYMSRLGTWHVGTRVRPRTLADQRRLLFQAMAWPQRPGPCPPLEPAKEEVWRAKAAGRAIDLG
jgi:hypothetical protein